MFGRTPNPQDAAPDRASEPLFRNALTSPASTRPTPPAAPTPAAEPAAAAAPRPRGSISSLGSVFRLEGDITGEADLQLDGQVKGDLRVHRLLVGPTARVEGAIRAEHVEVHGRVVGSIEAQTVRLLATADVVGDISPGQLSIENGARFEGRVQPLREASRPEAPAAEPARPFGEAPRLRSVEGAGEPPPAAVTAA